MLHDRERCRGTHSANPFPSPSSLQNSNAYPLTYPTSSLPQEFPCVYEPDLIKAIPELIPRSKLLFHAELETEHSHAVAPESEPKPPLDPTLYSTFLASRPQSLETAAIDLVISLHRRFPSFNSHIVHLSASSALPSIRAAKSQGLALTVETCFHYLCLTSAGIPDGRPEWKCCPPIREKENQDLLWEGVLDGTIDCVVSDHSPCVAELKRVHSDGDFMSAWGGIATLGLGISLLWTEGRRRGVRPGVLFRLLSERTAGIGGLEGHKGVIRVGMDADLVVFDPEERFTVSGALEDSRVC